MVVVFEGVTFNCPACDTNKRSSDSVLACSLCGTKGHWLCLVNPIRGSKYTDEYPSFDGYICAACSEID